MYECFLYQNMLFLNEIGTELLKPTSAEESRKNRSKIQRNCSPLSPRKNIKKSPSAEDLENDRSEHKQASL